MKQWEVLEGDCLDVLPTLEPGSVALVVTDPPYGVASKREYVRCDKPNVKPVSMDFGEWDYGSRSDFVLLWGEWIAQVSALVRDDAALYAFCPDVLLGTTIAQLELWKWTYRNTLVWAKSNPPPKFCKNTWINAHELVCFAMMGKPSFAFDALPFSETKSVHETGLTAAENNRDRHPCEKPVSLIANFIQRTTNPGDLVLDPFCGSGSTGEAALGLGRRFIGIEQDPKWAAVARKRLSQNRLPFFADGVA